MFFKLKALKTEVTFFNILGTVNVILILLDKGPYCF